MGSIIRAESLINLFILVSLVTILAPNAILGAGAGSGNHSPNSIATKNIKALQLFYRILTTKKDIILVNESGTMSQTFRSDQGAEYGAPMVLCLANQHKKATARIIITLTGIAALASNRLLHLNPANFLQSMAAIEADYIRMVQLKERLAQEAASTCFGLTIKGNDPIITALNKAVRAFG